MPFDLINEDAGMDIGRGLGRVMEVDCKAMALDQAHFLCIQTKIALDKPFRRGGLMVSPKSDKVIVSFKFEILVGLCFNYERLEHEPKGCTTR